MARMEDGGVLNELARARSGGLTLYSVEHSHAGMQAALAASGGMASGHWPWKPDCAETTGRPE